ncbi:MAG: DUF86 domain-containing protein [Phascolarctobacterium sp.]|nr:DUF86 domain-containing protein [Candidatus Phascolarctobacterium caballi]
MVNDKDKHILENILYQCKIMEKEMTDYRLSPKLLSDDGVLFNACCHTIFQIGELANSLSSEFKQLHTSEDWAEMYSMRNIIGHHYGSVNIKLLWETACKDIPKLRQTCEKILAEEK